MPNNATDFLAGKTALVTGANGAIGGALVQAFVNAGATLVVGTVRRAPPRDEPGVKWVALDLLDAKAIVRVAAEWAERVDILVNNAGVNGNCTLLAPPDAGLAREEMEVNYFGALNMVRSFAPAMQ